MRRKDDEKEQRIKEAVIEVVLEEGFGGASISKIAKKAEVAPATVYIYYENKEAMLRSIYLECTGELYDALLGGIEGKRGGAQIIEALIRGYFDFIVHNGTMFAFIEQFSSSPALTHDCAEIRGFSRMMELLAQWQAEGWLQPYNTVNVFALLFHPVKMLAAGALSYHTDAEPQLRELISITQAALLTQPQQ